MQVLNADRLHLTEWILPASNTRGTMRSRVSYCPVKFSGTLLYWTSYKLKITKVFRSSSLLHFPVSKKEVVRETDGHTIPSRYVLCFSCFFCFCLRILTTQIFLIKAYKTSNFSIFHYFCKSFLFSFVFSFQTSQKALKEIQKPNIISGRRLRN